jgi:O-antigen/teichoic acid export membrane protein
MSVGPADSVPVRSHGRALGRDLAIYGLSTLLLQGATILLTPVLTRVLGPDDYGVYELLQVALGFLSIVLVLGMDIAVLKVFFDDEAMGHRQRVVSTGLAVVTLGTLVGALAIVLFVGPLSVALLGDDGQRAAIVAAAVALPATVLMTYTRQTLRIERRPWNYFVSSIIGAVAQVAVVVVLVVRTHQVASVFVGLTVGAVLATAYCLWASRHLYRPSISASQGRSLLAFGAPLVLTGIAGWSVMFVDRLILTRFVSLEEIGFYGVANKVALVLNLVIYSFGAGWPPFILELTASDAAAAKEVRSKALNQFLVAVACVGLPAAALAPEVVRILAGPAFLPAAAVVPILVLAFLAFATLPITQIAMMVTERSKVLAPPAIAAAVVNIVGCFVLCPRFGIAGASWATVAGFGVQAVAYYVIAQRIDRVPYPIRGTLAFFGLTLPFLALGWWQPSLAVGLLVKVPALVLFPVLLLVLRIVDRSATVDLVRRIALRRA